MMGRYEYPLFRGLRWRWGYSVLSSHLYSCIIPCQRVISRCGSSERLAVYMNRNIPDEVRRKTTRCHHNLSCLTTGKCGSVSMCEVESRVDEELIFVKASDNCARDACPYTLPFGYGRICTCPTRNSIYTEGR